MLAVSIGLSCGIGDRNFGTKLGRSQWLLTGEKSLIDYPPHARVYSILKIHAQPFSAPERQATDIRRESRWNSMLSKDTTGQTLGENLWYQYL